MKQIIFYVFTALIAFFMAYMILNNEEKQSPKLLTIDTTYSYLYDENQKMEIPFFINHKHHPLNDINSYELLYLSDEEESKRVEVELLDIRRAHFETYLGETYQHMILSIKLPFMSGPFEIKDAFIHIYLVNQDTYQFQIGDFYLNHVVSNHEFLHWHSLYGAKKENQFISRLSEIHIPYESLEKPIKSISIGTDDLLSFSIDPTLLKITIMNKDRLLYNVPLVITFDDDSIQTIHNFRYLIDYQLLLESGPLVNIYALD
jgi:hypothetical protein